MSCEEEMVSWNLIDQPCFVSFQQKQKAIGVKVIQAYFRWCMQFIYEKRFNWHVLNRLHKQLLESISS